MMFKKYSYFTPTSLTQKTMKTEHFRQPLSLMRFLAVILITIRISGLYILLICNSYLPEGHWATLYLFLLGICTVSEQP